MQGGWDGVAFFAPRLGPRANLHLPGLLEGRLPSLERQFINLRNVMFVVPGSAFGLILTMIDIMAFAVRGATSSSPVSFSSAASRCLALSFQRGESISKQ